MIAPDDTLPDVTLVEGFVPDPDALFHALLTEVAWDARMFARKTASFGAPYNYAQMTYDPAPMPARLAPVVARLAERLGHRYDNCLMNLYEDGARTMGFHVDELRGLAAGAGVAVVSLGATRTLVFRRVDARDQRARVALRAGSLLWMPPAVQDLWQHGVLAEPGAGPRISLTFRALAPIA